MHDETATLVSRLLAQRWLPRDDAQARKALLDEGFREELDRRLAAVGLELREHPYSAYIGLAVARSAERTVFGGSESWISNTLQLDRDAVALLVVLWALIVLPKRQRQIERQQAEADASQTQMFAEGKPISRDPALAPVLAERTVLADFGDKLGGKMRVNINLGQLARHGFIVRRKGELTEGPLLDLAFDYERTARRILDGALGDLLADVATRRSAVADTDDGIDDLPLHDETVMDENTMDGSTEDDTTALLDNEAMNDV
jgi:hypothetical protein